MVVVATTFSVNGGRGDGHPCCQLRRWLMATAAVDGGGGDGCLCLRWSSLTEAEVGWSRRRQWGHLQQQWHLMAVAAMALFFYHR